jgi:cytochrome b6-f complex iron-sulfur subunit
MGAMNRRQFISFSTAGAAALLATSGTALASFVRFLFPTVYYEPPQRFKIGYARDFPIGIPTFLPQQKIYVFRDGERAFSVASAVCTHLGCTVQWFNSDHEFHCPCHGSIFASNGKVLHGPAPRPLDWWEITLAKDGQLQVDKGKKVAESYRLELPA